MPTSVLREKQRAHAHAMLNYNHAIRKHTFIGHDLVSYQITFVNLIMSHDRGHMRLYFNKQIVDIVNIGLEIRNNRR